MHGIGVHDPGHDLGVGTHVGRGDVAFRADEEADLGGIAPGQPLQFAAAQLAGVDDHAALGAAVGQVHQRAFPRHPHGQRAAFVQRHLGVIADAALGRAFDGVVVHAKAGEHAHMTIVHAHGEMHDQLALGRPQVAADVLVQLHEIGHLIELRLGNGIRALAHDGRVVRRSARGMVVVNVAQGIGR